MALPGLSSASFIRSLHGKTFCVVSCGNTDFPLYVHVCVCARVCVCVERERESEDVAVHFIHRLADTERIASINNDSNGEKSKWTLKKIYRPDRLQRHKLFLLKILSIAGYEEEKDLYRVCAYLSTGHEPGPPTSGIPNVISLKAPCRHSFLPIRENAHGEMNDRTELFSKPSDVYQVKSLELTTLSVASLKRDLQ